MSPRNRLSCLLLATLAAACGGGATTEHATSSAGAGSGGASSLSTGGGGGGGELVDAGEPDAAPVDDGAPTRVACTGNFGNALDTNHGRLDGFLVSIVPTGLHSCNGDSGHVHLQVQVKGAIYDVAINTDVLFTEGDYPIVGGPWAEGWHANATLDYVQNVGVHAAGFKTLSAGAVIQTVEAAVANANHVAIFATGYGPTGAHDVHRRGYFEDGAILIDPLSPKPHWLLFRFSTQSF